jgi:thiol:disulfide interchange protein DsbD
MRALIASLLLFSSLCQGQVLGGADRPAFGAPTLGAAAGKPHFLPIDQAYQLEVEIAGEQQLRIYWQIAPEYYLYQHRFAFELTDADGTIPLEASLPPALARADEFFGEVRVYYDHADVPLQLARTTDRARLSVTYQGCADAGLCYPPETRHFDLNFAAGDITRAEPPRPGEAVAAGAPERATMGGLLYMMLLAFIGGSILNLMPCVFPILSLKVLSFTRSTAHDRHVHSWLYAAGVVASFVLVAAVLIALQQAGRAIGWGFQLQSPAFVIALAYLFVAMGLSLSGLFEFGGSVMNAGSSLADRGGLSGSFFTGVLAVVVASPCTAPFMGTALGFALTQPPLVGLLVFAALGAGMAAPLLLFSYSGAARRLMPRPGPWMETLKQLLAFPLYGTAIWLLWVAGRQTGVNTMAVALAGALALALGLWLWRYGGWRRGVALACCLLAATLATWRGLDEADGRSGPLDGGRVAWSEQRLAELRRAGTPVFVDVTADWCITCIANERAVLLTDEMTAAFDEHGVVYMVADWTNYDPAIARYIAGYGRSGIPLYLMYPGDPGREPLLLPQLLTRSTVLEALQAVSRKGEMVAEELAANDPLAAAESR